MGQDATGGSKIRRKRASSGQPLNFFLYEITLEVYFDRLIGHLTNDAARHIFDTADSDLRKLLRVDVISGAVKFQMLNQSFRRLDNIGTLCMSKFECVLSFAASAMG